MPDGLHRRLQSGRAWQLLPHFLKTGVYRYCIVVGLRDA
jgi:hypothetical protein